MSKYIITDPCYILNDIVWDNACKECFDDSPEQYANFDKRITQELNKLANTNNALASGTGYGDWNNEIYSSNGRKVLQSEFFADSGMVCVVEYNEFIQKALEEKDNTRLIERGGCALIETVGRVSVKMDMSNKDWTVVEIYDDESHFHSRDPEEDEEEDEWIEDDEYYEEDDDE